MSDFHLFRPLFDKIDAVTATYVTDMSARASAAVSPYVAGGITIALLVLCVLIIRGAVDMPIGELMAKMMRTSIIIAFALGGGIYQGQITPMIRTMPDALATALVSDASGTGTQAADLVDNSAGSGFDKVGDAWEKAHTFSLDAVFYVVVGLIMLVGTVAIVAVGGAFIILAKVALAILAGVGPIFIVALLWAPTQKFFDAWVGQVASYTLLVVMVAATFGFMLTIYTGFMDSVEIDEAQNVAYNLGGILILSVAMVIVLIHLPGAASQLGGGFAMQAIHELRTAARGAGAAGAAAGSAAGKAAQAAGQVGQKVWEAMRGGGAGGAGGASGGGQGGRGAAGRFRGAKAA